MKPRSAKKNVALLGVDIGSSTIKATLFNERGRTLGTAAKPVTVRFPQPGWVERDPQATLRAAHAVIRAALDSAKSSVTAVGVTGCGNGGVFLDAKFRPLGAGILASDLRATDFVAPRGKRFNEPYPGQTGPLLDWWRSAESPRARDLAQVLWWKDYVRMSLTGVACTDFTDAGAAGLLDLSTRSWRNGQPELPPLRESAALAGWVTPNAADATNLPSGTPVFTGCIDCEAAAIGSGVSEPDRLSIVAGTWSINQAFVGALPSSTTVFLCNPSSQPGRWLLLEGSPTSASHFDWLVRAVGGRTDFEKVAALAAAAPASELHFLPRLFAQNAAFVGLGPQHDLGAMARAVMAGVAYSHRAHVEKLRAEGLRFRVARLAGGATRSPFWCQLFADVLGLRIEVPAVAEPGALGAALLAGVGAGVWPSLAEAQRATVRVDRTFEPDPASREIHQRAYARFQKLSALSFP